MVNDLNPWLPIRRPVPNSVTRLFCFPHAGGNAQVYRHWQSRLGAECEVCAVQLPGRWNRVHEPAISNLPQLIESALDGLGPFLGDRFALFGYSVGALIAFEFARELRRRGLPAPRQMWVAARRAPQVKTSDIPIRLLSDHELIEIVAQRYGAIPQVVLDDPGMREIILPILRSDLALDQNYQYIPQPPLDCPITVFGGIDDRAASPDALEAWREHTRSSFRLRMFAGGHFFLNEEQEAVLDIIDGYWRDQVTEPSAS
ncbi:MAG: alpha/beta fold hydrolase [Terracidiphilus sp.]